MPQNVSVHISMEDFVSATFTPWVKFLPNTLKGKDKLVFSTPVSRS